MITELARIRSEILSQLSTTKLLTEINHWQNIQRNHPPTSAAWICASESLEPMFAEMARREQVQS